jgi:hypothetical protein
MFRSYHHLQAERLNLSPQEGVEACRIVRLPRVLDNEHTYVGNFVHPTQLPSSTPEKHYFSASGTHIC